MIGVVMTDPLALVLPDVYGEYDPLVALWMLRLALNDELALREITRGHCSEELRLLLGVQPIEGDLHRKELRPLLKVRLKDFDYAQSLMHSTLAFNVRMLGELLGMDELPQLILMFVALSRQHMLLNHFVDSICKNSQDAMVYSLSIALNASASDVRRALRHDGELLTMKLIHYDKSFPTNSLQLILLDELRDVLFISHDSVESLMNCFIEQAPAPRLQQSDFPHLSDETQLLKAYLLHSHQTQQRGVNVLLFGIPGMGKTEYVRWLAADLGKTLYQVKCADAEGNSISRRGRLMFYQFCQFCQRFLSQANALVLFDEVEDVFSDALDYDTTPFSHPQSVGKAWLNTLLETNPVPTIWVSNHVDHMDKAYLRRFDFSVEMGLPPKTVRDRMLQHYLQPYSLSTSTLTYLSQQALTPAQIEKAAKVLEAFKATPLQQDARLKQVIHNSMQLLELEPIKLQHDSGVFDLQYLNMDVDISQWLSQLKQMRHIQGALCFYGAPGTGKTVLAHHIAKTLDRPLHVKTASQVLSPYLGMTEQNMAQMFKLAQKEGAVLVLDEADSFLSQRKTAAASWEVTQVNEMLVQMERFEGLFICTTNLMACMDEASLRRFTFKIKFDYLNEVQRWQLFQHYVPRIPAKLSVFVQQALKSMGSLTPGDYANVQRQCKMLGITLDAEGFLQRLQLECKAKPNETQRGMGFLQSNVM
jgi:SpoVK/Ycf46/Vps4 family AAA+-type ATPase